MTMIHGPVVCRLELCRLLRVECLQGDALPVCFQVCQSGERILGWPMTASPRQLSGHWRCLKASSRATRADRSDPRCLSQHQTSGAGGFCHAWMMRGGFVAVRDRSRGIVDRPDDGIRLLTVARTWRGCVGVVVRDALWHDDGRDCGSRGAGFADRISRCPCRRLAV